MLVEWTCSTCNLFPTSRAWWHLLSFEERAGNTGLFNLYKTCGGLPFLISTSTIRDTNAFRPGGWPFQCCLIAGRYTIPKSVPRTQPILSVSLCVNRPSRSRIIFRTISSGVGLECDGVLEARPRWASGTHGSWLLLTVDDGDPTLALPAGEFTGSHFPWAGAHSPRTGEVWSST